MCNFVCICDEATFGEIEIRQAVTLSHLQCSVVVNDNFIIVLQMKVYSDLD